MNVHKNARMTFLTYLDGEKTVHGRLLLVTRVREQKRRVEDAGLEAEDDPGIRPSAARRSSRGLPGQAQCCPVEGRGDQAECANAVRVSFW